MKLDLRNKNLQNIKIQNTSLVGSNFVSCNFSGSQFNNVNITGINLNGAQLINCKWKILRIHELNKFNGHRYEVRSICFSPDGKKLASVGDRYYGGGDCSIRLWDVKAGQQKAKLDGHTSCINSVCFSPMEIHQLLVVEITLFVYGIQTKNISNIMVYPDFNFSRYKRVFQKQPFHFNLKTNLYQPLIQIYFNKLLVSNIC
ncbi:unnamed protein product [Paramecium primaurelia]|uniref:Uncharacterized protein n=1 Tax=Paramecium primaurelia TaxID=5886 RepID=A0A8S1QVV4_PARPR|nr:unnamed protein product [Paramecium primaurelia]